MCIRNVRRLYKRCWRCYFIPIHVVTVFGQESRSPDLVGGLLGDVALFASLADCSSLWPESPFLSLYVPLSMRSSVLWLGLRIVKRQVRLGGDDQACAWLRTSSHTMLPLHHTLIRSVHTTPGTGRRMFQSQATQQLEIQSVTGTPLGRPRMLWSYCQNRNNTLRNAPPQSEWWLWFLVVRIFSRVIWWAGSKLHGLCRQIHIVLRQLLLGQWRPSTSYIHDMLGRTLLRLFSVMVYVQESSQRVRRLNQSELGFLSHCLRAHLPAEQSCRRG